MKTMLIILLFFPFTFLFGETQAKVEYKNCHHCDEIKTTIPTEQGDSIAQCRLRCICINWVNLEQAFRDKVQPTDKTAIKKELLTYMHKKGILEIYDLKKAAEKKDNLFAKELLGYMYWEGVSGLPQNYEIAAYWYEQAANNGSIGSQYLLGLLYFYGKGVSQNYKESENWLMTAANNGNYHAQYFLGLMYYTGRGVKKDYIRAYVWLRVASVFGSKQTVKLEQALKHKLSKNEITEANNLSKLLIERYKAHKNRIDKLFKKILKRRISCLKKTEQNL
jgi:hypothetical protein